MNETVLKQDVGLVYKAELVNAFGHVEVSFEGSRAAVEAKLKSWVATLIHGDTIRFVRLDKETEEC